jgi:hypothetical protein
MKTAFITCILFLACNCFAQKNSSKHALLFAVASYPETSGWDTLSTINDITHLGKALRVQGFPDANITTLINEQVTLEGIKNAFAALVSRVKPNDIVVVHFSSHGTQIEAENDNKIDGLDECVVPHNAVAADRVDADDSARIKLEMAKYLRGHVLGDMLKQLRAKLGKGGDLAVFLDFCNSGGATRGAGKVRGGKPPMVFKNFNPARHKSSDSSLLFRQASGNAVDESLLAPYVVISATRPYEPDVETTDEKGIGIGPLSYALYKTLTNLDPNTTYQSFFAKIQAFMNEKVQAQHPVLEGNGPNRLLFGGAFVQQQPFIEIEEILPGKQLRIKGGALAGLGEGAVVGIYPAGTIDPAKATAIASGKVVQTGSFFSVVALDKDPAIQQPAEGWAFITEPQYSINPVSVKIITAAMASGGFSTVEETAIRSGLHDFPAAAFNDHADVWIVKGRGEDSIKVASNGYLFSLVSNAVSNSSSLKEKIRQYAQYQLLQAMKTKEEGISVEVKLIPVIDGKADTAFIAQKMVNGMYEFSDGDVVTLSIRNTGKRPVYVNILDLQPDGIINAILPKKNIGAGQKPVEPHDLLFSPGQEFVFKPADFRINLSGPFGTEIFKVFASRTEIDLETIATTRGEGTRGNLSALELMVRDSYRDIKTRGGSVATTRTGNANGTTSEILFRIKPKE